MGLGTGVALGGGMASPSQEYRIPTQTFLLPGQQFCIGLPWEREHLPKHGLPAARPKPALAKGTTLDEDDALDGDPVAGWTIGRLEILRRLSQGSARRLLALRREAGVTAAVVDVRRLELQDALAPEIEALAAVAARWSHPHLARVYPAEASEEGLFWVSERVSGASLSELMEACRGRGKGLPLGLAYAAVVEAGLGLAALHERGEGHGLLGDQAVAVGFDGQARVLDAGLFRVLARRASWAEVLQVTGPYLSPEQVLRGHMPDPRCDVFSLGMVLYECLTGDRLKRSERFEDRVKLHERGALPPPSSLNVMVTKDVDAVVMRALEADRAKRYATAPELAQALREAAGPFIWRADKRADFVGELFATRQRKEAALTAHLARELERRTRSLPQLKVVELPPARVVAPRPAPRPVRAAPPRVVTTPPRKKKGAKAAPGRRGEVLAVGVAFLAAFGLSVLAFSDLGGPVAPVELATARAPLLEVDGATVSTVEPPMGPAVSEPVSWARPAPSEPLPVNAAPAKQRPAKKKVKKQHDAPLPPWLR